MPRNVSEQSVPVEVMHRHAHLSSADQEILFGKGHEMTVLQPMRQEGQFVYRETVEVRPSGKSAKSVTVSVVGPCRTATQVELSASDTARLGLRAPERVSGDISGSAPCLLVGPKGRVALYEGLIVPRPHLHCSDKEAKQLGLSHGQAVTLMFHDDPKRILKNVAVRVHPTFRLLAHLTTDEAAAHWLHAQSAASIVHK